MLARQCRQKGAVVPARNGFAALASCLAAAFAVPQPRMRTHCKNNQYKVLLPAVLKR